MGHKILLIGDSAKDVFIYGKVSRLCPDCPAAVLDEERIVENPGMAHNVRNNIVSLGGDVEFITNDNWEEMRKTRMVEESCNYVFVRWDKPVKANRISGLEKIDYSQYSAVGISDYDKNFLSEEDIAFVAKSHPVTFLDTKKRLGAFAKDVTYIKLNHEEYSRSKPFLTPELDSKIIETIGPRGCRFGTKIFPVEEMEIRSVSGAGDSFFAGLIVNYVQTQNIEEAIKFGNKVASVVITKRGVNVVTIDELKAHKLI